MSLTLESGAISSKQKAARSQYLYNRADRVYGTYIHKFRGHVPPGMAIAHLLNVNPDLLDQPPITKDRRRGFLLASTDMAMEAGVEWENLDDPLTCAYVWGRDINNDSLSLYTSNQDLFAAPDRDFWSTAYIKHYLGDAAFNTLWPLRDRTQPTVYESIVYSVSTSGRRVPGWPIVKLKKALYYDCPFVINLALSKGTMASEGYGIQPVISQNDIIQVY